MSILATLFVGRGISADLNLNCMVCALLLPVPVTNFEFAWKDAVTKLVAFTPVSKA